MSDHHIVKNVMGELTFGEYWNLVACNSAVAVVNCPRLKINKKMTISFSVDAEKVMFHFPGSFNDKGKTYSIDIYLREIVQVAGNKAKTMFNGKPVEIEFYDITPVPSLMP